MAPSRRKGSARAAAAAAAARQQWKIGDLVLAKMKGFPAWPAMISEPEKWGFSSDRKKLLVYFYGTKQIAFCNYADIEAFTEEKKKSLLIKRQGKGSDFVRAVEEIVDVYESLKENLARDSPIVEGNDGEVSNKENLEESRINCFVQNVDLSLSSSLNLQSQADSATECCDKVTADETPGALLDGSNDNNVSVINDSTEKISILDELRQIPLSSVSTRKRERDALLPSSVTNLTSSLRRSRSSAGNKPCKSQKSCMQVNSKCDVVCSAPDILSEEPKLKEQIVVRGPHITTSTEASSISSSVPLEDIISVKPEVPNSDDGSLLEFSGKLEPLENDTSPNAFSNEDLKLNGKADIPLKTVVTKNGRKPPAHKKQVSSSRECSEMDKELDLPIGGSFSDFSNFKNGIIDKLSNTDGDEHLPLVKRARVRMGKLPIDEKDDSVRSKVKLDNIVSSNGFYGDAGVSSPVINCSIPNGPRKRSSPVAKEVSGSSTNAGAHCNTGKEMLSCKTSKYQLMPDVEAALPPSKRLHRALEAMSANAIEADNDWLEAPSATETKSIDCLCSSQNVGCINTDVGVHSPIKSLSKQYSERDIFHDTACHLTSSSISQDLMVSFLNSSGMEHVNILQEKVLSNLDENSKEILTGSSHLHGSVNSKITGPLPVSSSELVEESCNDCGPNHSPTNVINENDRFQGPQLDKECAYFQRYGRASLKAPGSCDSQKIVGLSPSSQATTDLSASEIGGAAAVSLARNADSSACDMNGIPSTSSAMNAGFLAGDLNGGAAALLNNKVSFEANDISKAAMSSRFLVEGNSQIRDMQNDVVEAKQKSALRNRSIGSNLAPIKELIAAAQAKRFLSRSTFNDNVIDDKIGPDTVVSPSLINKEDSSGRGSPSNPIFCPRPASDDGTCHLQNGSRTPLSSSSGKGFCKFMNHAEANAARRSFESVLCTLSRTKESIGRATRIAIDCAKYGIAGEVIDILLRYLEKESSLHRRVDLFFLVDSITQCSRCQKGGPGDVFPSLVQAVLPRLLAAVAPPGNGVSENRRQCLKVLRLWLERRTLPEFIIRHHIRELEHGNEAPLSISYSRRPSRTERALNDPVREMEGMLVDEYGSNASFQLPQLFNTRILEYEDGSADEKVFEAVTPDRNAEIDYGKEMTPKSTKKHRLVLEDVDGELEMEDVAPPSGHETELSTCHGTGAETSINCKFQREQNESLTFAPLPEDRPPSPPPLPSSPPPMPPPHSAAESQAPRTSAGLNGAADRADFNLSGACYTAQSQLPQLISQLPTSLHGSSSLSEPVSFYSKVYGCHPQRMPPLVSSNTSSGSYLNFLDSQSAIPLGNNPQPIVNMPSANKVYHLPPPPPVVSNQFSYIQAPPHHRPQASENHSFYSDRLHQSHDIQRGNFHVDRVQRGPMNGDVAAYPAVPSGCMGSGSEKVETQVSAFYGPHQEPSSAPCQAWSYPPITSTYPVSAHISPLENPVSGVTGAPAYWRAR